MKKTIITLLALAGVAMGEEITMPSDHLSPIAFGQNSTSITLSNGSAELYGTDSTDRANWNNWMIEFQLSDINLQKGATHKLFTTRGEADSLELYIKSDAETGALTMGFATDNVTVFFGDAIALEEGITYRAAYHWANNDIHASYITNTVTGVYVEGSPNVNWEGVVGRESAAKFYSEGAVTVTLGDAYNMWNMQVGDVRDSFKAYATLATNADAVPEPTTATLSLLALAGLAARRRRK